LKNADSGSGRVSVKYIQKQAEFQKLQQYAASFSLNNWEAMDKRYSCKI